MARIRTIKPEFWKHEELSATPESTHMLAAALLNYADDDGYFNANPKLIKSECFPLREPQISIEDSLKKLSSIGFIKIGAAPDGRIYGHVVNFSSHQRISRPSPSKVKDLQIVWEDSARTPRALTEDSVLNGKERNREQGTERKAAEAAPRAQRAVVIPLEGSHAEYVATFCDAWKAKYGQPYPFQGGKHGEAVKEIRKHVPTSEAFRAVVGRYLANSDQFFNGHPLHLLRSQLERFLVNPARAGPDLLAGLRNLDERMGGINDVG